MYHVLRGELPACPGSQTTTAAWGCTSGPGLNEAGNYSVNRTAEAIAAPCHHSPTFFIIFFFLCRLLGVKQQGLRSWRGRSSALCGRQPCAALRQWQPAPAGFVAALQAPGPRPQLARGGLEVLWEMWPEKGDTSPQRVLLWGDHSPWESFSGEGTPSCGDCTHDIAGTPLRDSRHSPSRHLFHRLNCPGQPNDFSSWIIPVSLLNLLHPTVLGEASFFCKLFEYYTCKRILHLSWHCTQHGE